MFGQPTPFPWWLWVLAGLWTGGLVLRRVWPVGRETGWLLDGLIVVYTGLLAYMAATATTNGMASVGWLRAGWWLSGAMALMGAAGCALGATPRGRNIGWGLAIAGVASLAVWLQAPELAVLCAGVGVVGGLRSTTSGERDENQPPDPWLVAVTATVVCVAWLGTVEFALRTEAPRAGVSPRLTALPALDRVPTQTMPTHGSDLLLAGVVVLLAILDARPSRKEPEDRPA